MSTQTQPTGAPLLPSFLIHQMLTKLRFKAMEAEFGWGAHHVMAWELSTLSTEAPLRNAIISWGQIGETHRRAHGRDIGQDAVLGVAWKGMGQCLRIMLNADIGRFDLGTLDELILNMASSCGVDLQS